MIAAAEVTTISSLSAISTSRTLGPNLCFRYHVTAKYSAAAAKVVAENGDKKSPFLATKSPFSATNVAGNGDFVAVCRF